jgi:hypothetical protein
MKKRKPHLRETPEYLRSLARREASYIGQYGWRPSRKDLSQLRLSTRDAIAYRTLMRAWRAAGFKAGAVRRLAGRNKLELRGRARRHARAESIGGNTHHHQ